MSFETQGPKSADVLCARALYNTGRCVTKQTQILTARMIEALLILHCALGAAATTNSAVGFWLPGPGKVWEQVRYALKLPNYKVLEELNGIDDINLVNPTENYTVPYVKLPRSPAGWRTSCGVAYLELHTTAMVAVSPHATTSTRSQHVDGHGADKHEAAPISPPPESHAHATSPSSTTLDLTTKTPDAAQDHPSHGSETYASTGTTSSDSVASKEPVTDSAHPAEPSRMCHKAATFSMEDGLDSHAEDFCSIYGMIPLSEGRDHLSASYLSAAGCLHTFTLSWDTSCGAKSQKIDAPRCPSIMRDNHELCES